MNVLYPVVKEIKDTVSASKELHGSDKWERQSTTKWEKCCDGNKHRIDLLSK